MRRLLHSALIGGLLTWVGGAYYLLYALLLGAASGEPIAKTVSDVFVGCLLCWGIFTFLVYEVQGAFDEMNKLGRRDEQRDQKDKDSR